MALHDELRQIHSRCCWRRPRPLAPGGRLVVISFHSLEDRLVKQHLSFVPAVASAHQSRGMPQVENPFILLSKGTLTPTEANRESTVPSWQDSRRA